MGYLNEINDYKYGDKKKGKSLFRKKKKRGTSTETKSGGKKFGGNVANEKGEDKRTAARKAHFKRKAERTGTMKYKAGSDKNTSPGPDPVTGAPRVNKRASSSDDTTRRRTLRGPGKSGGRISDTGRKARAKGIRNAMKRKRIAARRKGKGSGRTLRRSR